VQVATEFHSAEEGAPKHPCSLLGLAAEGISKARKVNELKTGDANTTPAAVVVVASRVMGTKASCHVTVQVRRA